MQLYRADGKNKKTKAENFWEGLWTRQWGSNDDPEPHRKYGWLKLIDTHIDQPDVASKYLYNIGPFLSTSSDRTVADKYLRTIHQFDIELCGRHQADGFLFTFNIEDSLLQRKGAGIFEYHFPCNYNRYQQDPKFVSGVLGHSMQCNLCSTQGPTEHRLLVIDAATFLYSVHLESTIAYEKALQDKEWLLMPMDNMVGSPVNKGYQSRLPVADFWDVDFFRYDEGVR